MTIYIVQGKLGSGKGKYSVMKIWEALVAGRRVATNMDIYLDGMFAAHSRRVLLRVPDKPTAEDLMQIGHGNPDTYDEDRNGLLVLDEAGSWLNARAFNDPARHAFIDWMLHARKHGWDVILQVQDIQMVDKQLRTGLAEVLVRCIRADKVKIPVIGHVLPQKVSRLPRFHIANHQLADVPGMITDREIYRSDWLHKAYDTRQVFRSDYPHGVHSVLSAWHVKGRHETAVVSVPWWRRLVNLVGAAPARSVPCKPRHPLMARLAALPPDRRVYWARRLLSEGVL